MEPFKPTWLCVKQHNKTGLKYFCKTTKIDPIKYLGSGDYWLKHLEKHGKDVTTIWCRLYTNKETLVEEALSFSKYHDIVKARNKDGKKIWANAIDEDGLHGFPVGQERTEQHRKNLSKSQIGHPDYRTPETKAAAALKASEKLKGKKKPEGFGKAVGDRLRGTKMTDSARANMKATWTEEKRKAQSNRTRDQNASRPLITCPHCLFQGTNPGNMKRYHFDNCYLIKPKSPKQRNVANRAIEWLLLSPTQESIVVSNMREFCRENNLNNGTMSDVALGDRKQHKGWKVISVLRGGDTFP
jgi:hypothetical protein